MDLADVRDHVGLGVENEIAESPADEAGEIRLGETVPVAMLRQSGPLSAMWRASVRGTGVSDLQAEMTVPRPPTSAPSGRRRRW